MVAGGCSSAASTRASGTGAALAVGVATGCGADLTTARPRRLAGGAATGSATAVISVRPPTPGVTLIRPAEDQLPRRRFTLEGLQSQSRASAAPRLSGNPRQGLFIGQRADRNDIRFRCRRCSCHEVVPESLSPTHGGGHPCTYVIRRRRAKGRRKYPQPNAGR